MKKLIAGFGLLVLVFVLTSVADAAVIRKVNDSSTATSVSTWSVLVKMKNLNDADFNNNSVTSSATSGGNTFVSVDDQSKTTFVSGASDAETSVSNGANDNEIDEAVATYDAGNNTIEDIDDSSTATATNVDVVDNHMDNNNTAVEDTDSDATATSGLNAVVSGDSLTDASGTTGASKSKNKLDSSFNLNLKLLKRTK